MHMKLLIKSLRKDTEMQHHHQTLFSLMKQMLLSHLKSPFSKAYNKFSGEKSLSEYVKRCDSFVEPLELRLGFNAEMEKADTILYIPLYKPECSHEDALSEVLKSLEVTEHDNVLRTYHDGIAFKSNSLLNSEKKTLEIVF